MFCSQFVDCSGRIRKCGAVGRDMLLGWTFKFQKTTVSSVSSQCLSVCLWVERGKKGGNWMTFEEKGYTVLDMRLFLEGSKIYQLTSQHEVLP